jgi:hypothetical protein
MGARYYLQGPLQFTNYLYAGEKQACLSMWRKVKQPKQQFTRTDTAAFVKSEKPIQPASAQLNGPSLTFVAFTL